MQHLHTSNMFEKCFIRLPLQWQKKIEKIVMLSMDQNADYLQWLLSKRLFCLEETFDIGSNSKRIQDVYQLLW